MDLNSGYSHSVIAPDGFVEDHFTGRPALTMKQCRQGGLRAKDLHRRHYAQPHVYRYDPSEDHFDRSVTPVGTIGRWH